MRWILFALITCNCFSLDMDKVRQLKEMGFTNSQIMELLKKERSQNAQPQNQQAVRQGNTPGQPAVQPSFNTHQAFNSVNSNQPLRSQYNPDLPTHLLPRLPRDIPQRQQQVASAGNAMVGVYFMKYFKYPGPGHLNVHLNGKDVGRAERVNCIDGDKLVGDDVKHTKDIFGINKSSNQNKYWQKCTYSALVEVPSGNQQISIGKDRLVHYTRFGKRWISGYRDYNLQLQPGEVTLLSHYWQRDQNLNHKNRYTPEFEGLVNIYADQLGGRNVKVIAN